MKKLIVLTAALALLLIALPISTVSAATCSSTGYSGLTAARVNPSSPVTGSVDATGCNIGVYYDAGVGTVNNADIYGANYYGVFVNGDANNVSVNITNSSIHDIGDSPLNGNQRGVAIYYRGFGTGTASGKIWGNVLTNYQKGGIVTNGLGTTADIRNNTVAGQGPVDYIAQNGIQVGYGASAKVMQNTVTGNSYTGTSTVSGGIIVVGGPGYNPCPPSGTCAYTTGTIIDSNTVRNNDVGIWLSNIDESGNPPTSQTNVKVVNNVISNDGLLSSYYQAGIADQGNNDKMIHNTISGYTLPIDADISFTNRPKVHANVISP